MLRTSLFARCGLAALFAVLASCGGPAHTDGGSDGLADARLDAAGIDSTVDVAVDTGMPGAFGARCVNDVECASGICLFNGRCSRTCAGATDCPTSSNWHCVGLPGRGTVCDCTPTAATDTPCNRIDDDCNGVVDDGSQTCNGTCVDVLSDRANCGACGITCGGGSTCQAGHCACPPGQTTVCGTRCVSTATDPMNCGACGTVCPGGTSATASCVAGRCALACTAGAGDCDGNPANGCEADTRSSLANCGICGNACAFAHAGAACSTGSCVMGACTTGFANCDGDPSNGCETDPTTSTANCGACGRACAPAHGVGLCAAGACDLAACDAGFANCDGSAVNGCEAQLQSDARNCGACGRMCPGLGTPNTTATAARGSASERRVCDEAISRPVVRKSVTSPSQPFVVSETTSLRRVQSNHARDPARACFDFGRVKARDLRSARTGWSRICAPLVQFGVESAAALAAARGSTSTKASELATCGT